MDTNVNVLSFEKAKKEANHVYLIKGEPRDVVAKAIAESFNKALTVAKSDGSFVAVGEDALFAIEEKILEHYSKKAAGSIINTIAGFVTKIRGQ